MKEELLSLIKEKGYRKGEFTLSSGKSTASAFTTFSSPEIPVNKTVQSVFSSNSRIISLYCSSFKFGAEAPHPECNIT